MIAKGTTNGGMRCLMESVCVCVCVTVGGWGEEMRGELRVLFMYC